MFVYIKIFLLFSKKKKETTNNNNAGSHIPDALLKAMNGPPMSTKPFTYTPGGLDLSHVRESSRVKRLNLFIFTLINQLIKTFIKIN